MLADAGVYTVALLAVGSTTRRKTHAAAVSGVIQLALAVGLAFEIARRAVSGSEPMSLLMILISALALVANAACVVLLRKHRHGEIHMRASSDLFHHGCPGQRRRDGRRPPGHGYRLGLARPRHRRRGVRPGRPRWSPHPETGEGLLC
jgi:hypothetical protein